jgi:hypothetical protein
MSINTWSAVSAAVTVAVGFAPLEQAKDVKASASRRNVKKTRRVKSYAVYAFT